MDQHFKNERKTGTKWCTWKHCSTNSSELLKFLHFCFVKIHFNCFLQPGTVIRGVDSGTLQFMTVPRSRDQEFIDHVSSSVIFTKEISYN